jgi:hypothetical protein
LVGFTGKHCFGGRSLHHLDLGASSLNPYEQATGIVGDRLSAFDEDNKIPCTGRKRTYNPGWQLQLIPVAQLGLNMWD